MPRNASGVYSLPAGNPVVTNTTISSVWANTTLDDLATAMTDSLSRSGDGGMLDQFLAVAGTVGAPGISFSLDPTAGLYRNGSGDLRMAIGGVDVMQWGSNAATLHGTAPKLEWDEGDAAADNQRWDLLATGESLLGRALLDDGTATTWMEVQRTAGTVDSIAFAATAFGFGGPVVVTAASPRVELLESDAAANNKRWDIAVSAEQLLFRTLLDDGTAQAWLTIDRTNGGADAIAFSGAPITSTSSITIDAATTSSFIQQGTRITNRWIEDDQAADEGGWRLDIQSKIFVLETNNDANSSQRNILTAARGTGIAITSMTIGNTTDVPILNLRCAQVEFEDGDATNPVITNSGDENTGFYFPSADEIGMTLGGTGYLVGFRNIPQRILNTTGSTVLADAGKHIYKASGGSGETTTIDGSLAYVIGDVITFVNQGGGTLTIAMGTDTMTWAATGGTGSRILADDGICTVMKVASGQWIISGTGLS